MNGIKVRLTGLVFLVWNGFLMGQDSIPSVDRWVDSVYESMNAQERIGQLFMIRAHSDKGPSYEKMVGDLIEKYQVGGLCFFQGTPERQAMLVNSYQQLVAKVPLMIAMDAEWGLGMRMKSSVYSFPRQLMLGAIQDNSLILRMGEEVAAQLKRVGTHVNFAPVADINNNPDNPVIHTRSFGEDKYNVAVKSYMYMKGLQEKGVMASAKHFPGHGDTDVDSHHDLPIIDQTKERLDSLELYPFKELIKKGIGGVMVAHLSVPALDDRANRPTTLSSHTIKGLLRSEMAFDGVIFTDALEMKGVTKHFEPGEVEAEALLAGNDMLVLPEDLEAAFQYINKYLSAGTIDSIQIATSVKRILRAKYKYGITDFQPLDTVGLRGFLNRPEALQLKENLIAEALTLVRNQDTIIPIKKTAEIKIATLNIGNSGATAFQQRLEDYAELTHYYWKDNAEELLTQLSDKNLVVVGIHNIKGTSSTHFNIDQNGVEFLKRLSKVTKVIITIFGTPYSLELFDDFNNVVMSYEEDSLIQDLTAQALFGAIPFMGRLPVTASPKAQFNQGLYTQKLMKFGYRSPNEVKMNADTLRRIEEVVQEGIQKRAFPGAVVLVAKKGQIIYHEAFGHQTYSKRTPIRKESIFDLASITKVAASTLAVMKLEEEGKIDLDAPIGLYLPDLFLTDKEQLTLREIMTHTAGLRSWIPFYAETVERKRKRTQPSPQYYQRTSSEAFSVQVSSDLYMRKDYIDSIKNIIYCSSLRSDKDYVYSDLGFIMIADLVQNITGMNLEDYVASIFYRPLELEHIGFNPIGWAKLSEVVPTEEDRYFRNQTIKGYVHDMAAAMFGGVSGHAGLFASAKDLAVVMQMILQGGIYGGRRYLKPQTVNKFTKRQLVDNGRAIGFDIRDLDTFGHLGFTGTMVWADPQEELLVVFLSNRTYPNMRNTAINRYAIRDRIMNIIYNAMEDRDMRFWARLN